MQNDVSQFVVNIIPLQNIQTNTSGLDATTILSNDVANLQQMVNFEQKRIYTDYLGAYTAGNAIQVLSPLNLSNVGITSNGSATGFGGSGSVSSLTNASTSFTLVGTTNALSTAISFAVGSRTIFGMGGTGNSLVYDALGQATEFRVSSMNLVGDRALFSTLNVTNTGTFGGFCYAQQFVTLSDVRAKTDISRLSTERLVSGIDNIHSYSYKYVGADTDDMGLLAQEVELEYPQAVTMGPSGAKYLKYDVMVSVLLEAVHELRQRVKVLEEK
jgi:hypothetical protein